MNPRIAILCVLAGCGLDGPLPPVDSGTDTDASGRIAPTLVQSQVVDAVWFVQWTTATDATSQVQYGLTENLGQVVASDTASTAHDLAMVGLPADTTVYWQAVSDLGLGDVRQTSIQSFKTGPLPADFRPPSLVRSEPGSAVAQGSLLTSQVQMQDKTSWVYILDAKGTPVWWKKARPGTMIVTSRPARNGDLLYAEWDLDMRDPFGTLVRVDLEGRSEDRTVLDMGHHDFYEWDDGTIGFIAFQADPAQGIVSDVIFESAEGVQSVGQTTQIYSWLDDYPVAPWMVCSDMAEGWRPDPSFDEWTHSNSLLVHPDGEHYLLLSRFHDSLLKIHRATGALVWQLNGQYGDITTSTGADPWTALGESELFSHAHLSQVTQPVDGTICLSMFDNGTHRTPQVSRLVEVCVDELTLEAYTTFEHEPGYGYTAVMGDMRTLDNSVLGAWGDLGMITEHGMDGSPLWEVQLAPETFAGRVRVLPALGPQP